ncbi:MAG: hypothetical protein AB7S26_04895 [Sandaracinaceae bacterium]
MGHVDPGLCGECAHVHRVETTRGTVYYRCTRADEDPRYAKYPNLPVRACRGYERADPDGAP